MGVTGIVGRSGCGKTSLLRCIAGLEPSASGTVRLGDTIWQDRQEFRQPFERSVGFVFQQPSLLPHLSVQQNLQFAQQFGRPSANAKALEHAVELLGLQDLLERQPDTLSGGEQQRVAIARAVASGPELMLFDEPLSALDEPRKAALLPYLERLHRELELPGLYVSHSISEVTRVADHLLVMENGAVAHSGPLEQVLSSKGALQLLEGAGALMAADATVVETDQASPLVRVAWEANELLLAGDELHPRQVVRIQIFAKDVSLALTRAEDSSILNILPAVVESIEPSVAGQVLVQLRCGNGLLPACVSQSSADRLRLQTGSEVFAQIKAVAVRA